MDNPLQHRFSQQTVTLFVLPQRCLGLPQLRGIEVIADNAVLPVLQRHAMEFPLVGLNDLRVVARIDEVSRVVWFAAIECVAEVAAYFRSDGFWPEDAHGLAK